MHPEFTLYKHRDNKYDSKKQPSREYDTIPDFDAVGVKRTQ